MKPCRRTRIRGAAPLLMPVRCVTFASAAPIGTAFTYQGQLKQGGVPVSDACASPSPIASTSRGSFVDRPARRDASDSAENTTRAAPELALATRRSRARGGTIPQTLDHEDDVQIVTVTVESAERWTGTVRAGRGHADRVTLETRHERETRVRGEGDE